MQVFLFLSFLRFASSLVFLPGVTIFKPSPQENLDITDDELVEGDMKIFHRLTRGYIQQHLWPNGVIFDEIDLDFFSVIALATIHAAMTTWSYETRGCIEFRRRPKNEHAYIYFFKGSGCWSHIGRTGMKQALSLDDGCWEYGTILHELGHAIGFLHEQARPDRDKYVEIKSENIKKGHEREFKINYGVNSLGTPYDYFSIMHYGPRFFSKNGQPTIVPKASGLTGMFIQLLMGQEKGLSLIDVEQTRRLYSCKGSTTLWCTFVKDMCGFEQEKELDNFDWTRKSGPTTSENTGPSGDHTSGKSYYMCIEAYSRYKWLRQYNYAKITRMVTLTGQSCMRFYYHMYGKAMGDLYVILGYEIILKKIVNQGNRWLRARVRLPGTGAKKLIFMAVRGKGSESDVSIDDIMIFDCYDI